MASVLMITPLLAFLFLSSTSVLAQDQCVYTVFIKTGWLPRAGTDANIGATFYTAEGKGIVMANFTDWGNKLDRNRNYFERNALDLFSGYGDCVDGPICNMNLTSDGTGSHHGWFSESLEITTAKYGQNCSSHHFTVDQWLATDVYPYTLSVVRDDCGTNPDDDDSHLKMVSKLAH